jgi:glycine oxidase
MIVVIGAGLIGLAVAYELAKRGADVRLLDAREPAGAASWAGAGMLAPFSEAPEHPEFAALCRASLERYPAFVAELQARTGVDSHLRLDGILEAAFDEAEAERLRARAQHLAAEGVRAAWLDRLQVRICEPALGQEAVGGLLIAEEGQVDNRRLGRALRAACQICGVRVEANIGDVALEADARRVLGVRTGAGFIAAGAVVNAAGAWAGCLEGVPEAALIAVTPVKGQMLALAVPRALLTRTLWVPGAYLVPRPDGRLLVGATVEGAGFDVRVTAAGLQRLLDACLAALPALGNFAVSETWAGLRPGTPDGLPYLGHTELGGYFVAAGHYRNGILLTPITATRVADAVEGKRPGPESGAFAAGRGKEASVAAAKP